MNYSFTNWLNNELSNSGWTMSELARHAGLSHATISNVLSGKTNPGFNFCTGIAKAFSMPPETVMRKAGLLPPHPNDDMEEGEFIAEVREMLRKLSFEDREFIYEMVKLQYQRAIKKRKSHESNAKFSP